ncbi:16168_t:CDS:2 [Funneliformis geosporum]|nr:16168_t:CDS:2 [Funneliformis geosporum]
MSLRITKKTHTSLTKRKKSDNEEQLPSNVLPKEALNAIQK